MAFVQLSSYLYACQRSDTKTIVQVFIGAKCWETDTDQIFIFDGTQWFEFENVVILGEHKRVHLGQMWVVSTIAESLVNDGNLDVVLTALSPGFHVVWRDSCGGDSFVQLYEAPTFTGGTPPVISNARRPSGDIGQPTAVVDPDITDPGVLLLELFNPGGTGGNAPGAQHEREKEMILTPETDYLFRITNKSNIATKASWIINGYVHV